MVITNKEIEALGLVRLGPAVLEDYDIMFYSINKSNHCFILQDDKECRCYIYNSDDDNFSFNIESINDLAVLKRILREANHLRDKTNFINGLIPHPNGGLWINGYTVWFDSNYDDIDKRTSGFAIKCENGEYAKVWEFRNKQIKFNSLEEFNKIISKW